MKHNDAAFATMLLVGSMAAEKEELVKPLNLAEYYRLRAGEAIRDLGGLGALIGMDVSGIKKAFGIDESGAYRICVLMNRVMPLSYALERFAETGISIVTIDEDTYPKRLLSRLGDKAPPMLYVCGELKLADGPCAAIAGEAAGEAADIINVLSARASGEGVALATGDEPGAGRAAEDAMLKNSGKLILCMAGAMSERIYQAGVSEMIVDRRALALSSAHPDALHTHPRAMERNRCLYALANFAIIMKMRQEKGAAWEGARAALNCGWIEKVYAWEHPSSPAGRRLIKRGAAAFQRAADITLSSADDDPDKQKYEQTSMF
jgi:predicted Rossmann fold nucleotide-binding protein DprA/Smf involved in DNA uptake